MNHLLLGIDIGGTNTALGIVDGEGHVLDSFSVPTRGFPDPKEYVEMLHHEVSRRFSIHENIVLKAIGIGAPSTNFYTGVLAHAPNMEWKGEVPIRDLVEAKFRLPVVVTNDANAAAMGEMKYGAAQAYKDFIMLTLGTGVGSGIVSNGQVVYGHDGFAGELGHVIAVRDGRSCGCGRRGCLETYTSATGVVRTIHEMLSNSVQPSLLRQFNAPTSKDLYDAAVAKDKLALDIFEFTGRILGQTLADICAITSPEAIVFFGGLARAGDYIFQPTQFYLEQNLLNLYQGKIKLLHSTLPENEAAILGAASLVSEYLS